MATIAVIPGGVANANIPIKAVPSGQSCTVGIILTTDAAGNSVAVTASPKAFISTGATQNVSVSVTIPTGGGSFYVWVPVTVNGIPVGTWSQGNTLIAQSVEVGVVTWS